MAQAQKKTISKGSAGTQPKPKSKNRKSLNPSVKASSGTRKTEAGSSKGLKATKTGKDITSRAAGEKPGTVHRSSKESRGERPGNFSKTKKAANLGPSSNKKSNLKRPASASRGRNSSEDSSRPFGQH